MEDIAKIQNNITDIDTSTLKHGEETEGLINISFLYVYAIKKENELGFPEELAVFYFLATTDDNRNFIFYKEYLLETEEERNAILNSPMLIRNQLQLDTLHHMCSVMDKYRTEFKFCRILCPDEKKVLTTDPYVFAISMTDRNNNAISFKLKKDLFIYLLGFDEFEDIDKYTQAKDFNCECITYFGILKYKSEIKNMAKIYKVKDTYAVERYYELEDAFGEETGIDVIETQVFDKKEARDHRKLMISYKNLNPDAFKLANIIELKMGNEPYKVYYLFNQDTRYVVLEHL